MPKRRCNILSAASVLGPKKPVASPGGKSVGSVCASSRCNSLTSSPLSPCLRSRQNPKQPAGVDVAAPLPRPACSARSWIICACSALICAKSAWICAETVPCVDVAEEATVAAHVVVATVVEASVACSVMECVPGATAIVCEVDVEPLPHKKANGRMPSEADAVQVMFVAVGEPLHVAVNAEAVPTNAKESMSAPIVDATIRCRTILM